MKYLWNLTAVMLTLVAGGIAVSQTAPAAGVTVVGSWKGDYGVKGIAILSIKSNHTWSQKDPSDPKDFYPKYDTGKWTIKGDLLTLIPLAKDAQPAKYTLLKDGNHLKSVNGYEITLIRLKKK